jgi:hypothetical protein
MHPSLYAAMAADARADELERRLGDLSDRLIDAELRATNWQKFANTQHARTLQLERDLLTSRATVRQQRDELAALRLGFRSADDADAWPVEDGK